MALEDLPDQESRGDTTPPLPAIAADAQDPEALRKSVEDSAAVSGGLWLSYLFVLFYLGIAAGGVTHADLLLQNPVKLPFLNVELPLLAFFFLAPLLFVITHAYALVNLALLADRVRQFHRELRDQIANPALAPRASKIRAALTRQLPSHIFVQFLGGPDEIRKGALGRLLAAILWVTLIIAPNALLLLLQIQFLPYHNLLITWTSRIALIVDFGLIWWLWRNILGSRVEGRRASFWRSSARTAVAVLFSASTILFACAVATIPGEWQEDHLPAKSALTFLRDRVFHGEVNGTTRHRRSLFSNTLVLPDFNIYEALKIDDPKKVEWRQYLSDLRGRDLKDAVLYGAVLSRADLTSAQLQGASLKGARLQGASLDGAELQGASLNKAWLRGASLDFARLQGTSLDYAELQGASLRGAFIWRTQLTASKWADLLAPAGSPDWSPNEYRKAWTDTTYAALRQSIEEEVPEGDMRDEALERVAILDCARTTWEFQPLASCDPAADLPDAVKQWKEMIEAKRVDENAHAKALAKILGDLVCSDDPDRIDVLRGLLRFDRFRDTGREMPAVAKRIMSPKCPVSTVLTGADKCAIAKASDSAISWATFIEQRTRDGSPNSR